ncbi:hypothetical protein C3L33_13528, partial [Rhododendron williamsianum]
MASVKVIGTAPSPYVNRVQIALNLKSVDYEFLVEPSGIYIDEVWTDGPGILPLDPYDQAMARFWAAYIDIRDWAKAAALEKGIEGIVPLEDAFAKCSKGKDFFGSDTIGYLDIAFGSFLGWLRAIEMMTGVKLPDETKTLGLFGWAEKFGSNAAVKIVIPNAEVFVEIINKFAPRANAQ